MVVFVTSTRRFAEETNEGVQGLKDRVEQPNLVQIQFVRLVIQDADEHIRVLE